VIEGAAGAGEGAAARWRRATHSPATPRRHLHGSRRKRVDFASTPWISPGMVGERVTRFADVEGSWWGGRWALMRGGRG
jgi:hypothetical protein